MTNLMVLRENSASSQDLMTAVMDDRRSASFDLRGRGLRQGSGNSGQRLLLQQHILDRAARERSFSSVPSSPSSVSGRVSEATSSVRSLLNSLRGRLSSGSAGNAMALAPQRSGNSFIAAPAAAAVAAEMSQASSLIDPEQAGRSRELSATLPLAAQRVSNSTMTTAGGSGPERNRSSGSKFWAAIGFSSNSSTGSTGGAAGGGGGGGSGHVRGLRVRMGVASGLVPRNTDIAHCALFELAKGE